MKIIHTSDLHLNSPMTARLSADKVRDRKGELFTTFEKMVDEAVFQKVSIFIIAGDLFDNERITKSAAERVLGKMRKAPSVDFLYLTGNHEKSALLESGVPFPQNLKIFADEWTYFDYGNVTVAGRSTIEPDMFEKLNLNYAKTNIVVLHGALADAKSGGEIIGMRDAAGKYIDYLALGHYHSYDDVKIDDRGVAVYSGTPEGRGFDEVGTKGFVMVEADGSRVRHSLIPFAKRTIKIVNVDITGSISRIDIDDKIEDELKGISSSDLIRVRLTGSRSPELYADLDTITARYENRYYHFEIKDDSKMRINPDDYKYDKSLKGEFIRLVLSNNDIGEEEKDRIIRTGLSALMGDGDEI